MTEEDFVIWPITRITSFQDTVCDALHISRGNRFEARAIFSPVFGVARSGPNSSWAKVLAIWTVAKVQERIDKATLEVDISLVGAQSGASFRAPAKPHKERYALDETRRW
jgi:hypothetical protein